MSLRPRTRTAGFVLVLSLLAGCSRQPAEQAMQSGDPAVAAPALAPPAKSAPPAVPAASGDHATAAPAVPAPAGPEAVLAPPPARSPDAVLRGWGMAIERRDWRQVRQLWGNHGADSGLSAEAFARRWDHLRRPKVTVGAGQQEGAAGSSFYTAPVRVDEGSRSFAGDVTIRRVNDVPGATPEQLRWHLDATTRAPWTNPR